MKKWLVLFSILFLTACSNNQAGTTEALDFKLEDVTGQVIHLSDFKDEKVYLKFWASWCSICLAGLEELNELPTTTSDFKVLTIVSPNFNNEKEKEDFIKWYAGLNNIENLTVLLDENGEIAKKFGVRGYPTSAFIGKNNRLIEVLPGHLANDMIIEKFAKIK